MDIEYLSATKVAQRLGVSAERVRQLARAGRLVPAQRTPLGQLWAAQDVEAFAATKDAWGRYSLPTNLAPGATDANQPDDGP